MPEGDEIVPLVNRLMNRFDHVVLTQDWHPPGHSSFASSHAREPFETVEMPYGEQILWPDHCIQGSRGAALHADLMVERAELILRKGYNPKIDSYSAFFENDRRTPTGLAGYLREREIESLYLVGLALDFCVHWSAVDGREQGFEVVVVEDGSRAIDTEGSLETAKAGMHEAGVRLIRAADVPAAP